MIRRWTETSEELLQRFEATEPTPEQLADLAELREKVLKLEALLEAVPVLRVQPGRSTWCRVPEPLVPRELSR